MPPPTRQFSDDELRMIAGAVDQAVPDRAQVGDALSYVTIQLLEQYAAVAEPERLRGLAFRIAQNWYRDEKRRSGVRRSHQSDVSRRAAEIRETPNEPRAEADVECSVEAMFASIWQSLTKDEQNILVWRFRERTSLRDIAVRIGVPESTARLHVDRARTRFLDRLSESATASRVFATWLLETIGEAS